MDHHVSVWEPFGHTHHLSTDDTRLMDEMPRSGGPIDPRIPQKRPHPQTPAQVQELRGIRRRAAAARICHLLALGSYLAAAFVPVLASQGDGYGLQLRYSTLGDMQDEVFLDPRFAVLWACVLGCTATALAAPRARAWGVVSLVVASVLILWWGAFAGDPPTLLWDGQDADGMWIGGMEVAEPSVGALLVTASAILFATGGICSLRTGPRRTVG